MANAFRHTMFVAVVGCFIWLLFLTVGSSASADQKLAGVLPWVILIALMLPYERLTTAGLQNMLKIWKGKDDDDSQSVP